MIESVTVTNYLGESLPIVLSRPWETGIAITDINGIGPERANVTVTEVTTLDGGFYNYARRPSREITIKIRYYEHDGVTCEDIRHLTYKYFTLKQRVRLTFKTEDRKCAIEGYVSGNAPDIFSKATSATITIICPDPYFYEVVDDAGKNSKQSVSTFTTMTGAFEFDFENIWGLNGDGSAQPMDTIIFGNVLTQDINSTVYYEGDGDEGVLIRIHALGDITYLVVNNLVTGEHMQLNVALETGYTAEICTIRGQKDISLYDPNGNYVANIMPYLTTESDWFVLSKGKNLFTYHAYVKRKNDLGTEETVDVTEDLVVTIFNRTKYEGI